jgi:hypothetical protein
LGDGSIGRCKKKKKGSYEHVSVLNGNKERKLTSVNLISI